MRRTHDYTEHGYQQHTAKIGIPLNAFSLISRALLCPFDCPFFPLPFQLQKAAVQKSRGETQAVMET